MGYRISWLAVEGVGKDRFLDALDLIDSHEPDEANEADFSIAELPTGWTVLWSNDQHYAAATAPHLARELAPTLAVTVNETAMHMTAALHDREGERWRVHHKGDERIDSLDIKGELPAEAAAIEASLRRLQAEEDAGAAEVDYLSDVPLEIARSVCGYRHDETRFAWGEPQFTVARKALPSGSAQAPSIWKRVFGGTR